MSTSALTRRMPTKRDGFSWARIPQQDGGVLYRLYRRDMRGVLHVELLPFHSDWECCRCVVARRLREARHRLRDTVDDIDLEIMGLTLELSCGEAVNSNELLGGGLPPIGYKSCHMLQT